MSVTAHHRVSLSATPPSPEIPVSPLDYPFPTQRNFASTGSVTSHRSTPLPSKTIVLPPLENFDLPSPPPRNLSYEYSTFSRVSFNSFNRYPQFLSSALEEPLRPSVSSIRSTVPDDSPEERY